MKLKIKQGTTSKLIRVFAQDSAATDGSGKTGIAYNASGLTAYYLPEGDAAPTAITLYSGTVGTYSSGCWSEVDSTNMPGIYEIGLPDAAIDATSEGSVIVMLKGATDMAPILLEIELDAVDYKSASSFGLSNLDAAISSRSTFDHSSNQVTTDSASRTASQADVTSIGTQLTTIDTVVDAVKVKTDQLTFTSPNSVDATASASVDTSAIATAVIAGLGGTEVTISSPVATDGTTITIVKGDDYNSSDSRQITWTGATADQWPSLSGATLSLTASNRLDSLTVVPTVTAATGTQAFQLELTKDQTNIGSGRYQYDVQATLASGRVVTLLSGELVVKKSYTD